ncbi:DNA topoisomerase II [Armadillidium vulgare iridescent virus]|uniref:DNA topoisomerase 2 n=1 Tax=Armadillidium vulgare iridescent virus TaxID=72201 RepID=A0A068QLQ0_9VIRU|nr:DNA topoisomerase II [Armadillidium vulgare iridescent virus]CCV02464.1 DNA topoisomerase II [Armadillidium vulgare iridescent virus]
MAKIKYATLSEIDHILKRPEVVIGSVEVSETLEYVVDSNFSVVEEKVVNVSEAMIRIFVEVLANAVDNIQRSKNTIPCKFIKIEIDTDGRTLVKNDGEIISISKNENNEGLYNHELVFGRLRSSSNYDDTISRETSGKNGLGVKCTNILSTSFQVTGVDPVNKKKLVQRWSENMKKTDGPKITASTSKSGYTEVEYWPEFKRLSVENKYSEDILGVLRKHILDVAMIASADGVSVYLKEGDKPELKVSIKKFLDYTKLFLGPPTNSNEIISTTTPDGKSELIVVFTESKKKSVSFVNGLCTRDGGQHVDGWVKPFTSQLLELLNKKKSSYKLTSKDILSNFRFFVKSIVDKPQFDSQNKNKLKFPTLKYVVPDNIIKKVSKWESVQKLREKVLLRFEKNKDVEIIKTLNDKRKRPKVSVKEYDPANSAGTSRSSKCTLIVCEGLSAKTYAVAGIGTGISFNTSKTQTNEVKKGREWFGILPLRGKFLNVRNASNEKMAQNAVVTDLVNAMGLTFKMDYSSEKARSSLNYGSIIIIPDPDEDGIHIEALVLNFFHYYFPSLLNIAVNCGSYGTFPFISSMKIPIIEASYKKKTHEFFTHEAFQSWKHDIKSCDIKIDYFKGLGTTTPADVPKKFGKKMVVFSVDKNANQSMDKAFKDEEADQRKEWLQNYSPENRTFDLDLPNKVLDIDITTFVDEELIKFSIEDCKRSLPHIMDGQKESQRKVIFGIKQWNGKKEGSDRQKIKVAQLGAFVAQKTDYKHGEQNLFETITKMAQDFVGSNNIPLLEQGGQFGTRLSGGKDAANPRYIFTKQPEILNKIFRPEDDPILTYSSDNGGTGEPDFYVPVIPLLCVNGSMGVGTGFSCNIPMFNPIEIINGIKQWISMRTKGEKYVFKGDNIYHPWYKNFTGKIEKNGGGKFTSYGTLTKKESGKQRNEKRKEEESVYEVTELPINMWTDKFKELCDKFVTDGIITEWKFGDSSVEKISFIITSKNDDLQLEDLKLKSYIHTSNMVAFDHLGRIHKFETLNGILQRFCKERVKFYEKRRIHTIHETEHLLAVAENKKRFMEKMMNKELQIFLVPDEKVKEQLIQQRFLLVSEAKGGEGSYEYLLKMSVRSFTKENVDKLKTNILKLKEKIHKYKNATDGSLWLEDIMELELFL